MKNKIVLIGFGNVGISYVSSLINQNINIDEIVIIDINRKNTRGEILDFNHCLPFVNKKLKIYSGNYQDCSDAKLAVITAGARQEVGETRMDLITKNAQILKDIVKNIVDNNFKGIILNATNPLDVMSDLIFKYSNYAPSRIIGSGTALDTARLKYNLKMFLDKDYEGIQAYVLGEHGDSSVVSWSNMTVDNNNVINNLTQEEKNYLAQKVRNAGYELLNTKGYSSQAIGMCLCDITKAIINDEQREICVSNYDKDKEVYYGYPAIIGKEGIIKRCNLQLANNEKEQLENSIKIIKEAIEKIS